MILMINFNRKTTFQNNLQINQLKILWVLTSIKANNNKNNKAPKRVYIQQFKKHKIDKKINNNLHII
jgi:hypothetical protein